MNRFQKLAWFNLVGILLCFAVLGHLFVEIFILKRLPESILGKFWPIIAYCVLTVISIILLRKKQSPAEVDSDERDNLIKKRAVIASFVSVWVLLAAASAIPRFVVGVKGSIPVWLLAFINLGVLLIALLVYSVAVLVQYSWGGKDGEK